MSKNIIFKKKDVVQDIDMVNSRPILLLNLFEKNDTNCNGLQRCAHWRRLSVRFKESLDYVICVWKLRNTVPEKTSELHKCM